jgi:hypothetical protein
LSVTVAEEPATPTVTATVVPPEGSPTEVASPAPVTETPVIETPTETLTPMPSETPALEDGGGSPPPEP